MLQEMNVCHITFIKRKTPFNRVYHYVVINMTNYKINIKHANGFTHNRDKAQPRRNKYSGVEHSSSSSIGLSFSNLGINEQSSIDN